MILNRQSTDPYWLPRLIMSSLFDAIPQCDPTDPWRRLSVTAISIESFIHGPLSNTSSKDILSRRSQANASEL